MFCEGFFGKKTAAEAFARLQLQQWSEAASDCDEVDVSRVSHDVSSCHIGKMVVPGTHYQYPLFLGVYI